MEFLAHGPFYMLAHELISYGISISFGGPSNPGHHMGYKTKTTARQFFASYCLLSQGLLYPRLSTCAVHLYILPPSPSHQLPSPSPPASPATVAHGPDESSTADMAKTSQQPSPPPSLPIYLRPKGAGWLPCMS